MGDQLLLFAVLGLGAGVVYAGLGLGLVVTYRGTAVVNIAQGATAMWGAYVYDAMRTDGRLYLPVVGVPNSIDLGAPTGVVPAVLAGVASSTLIAVVCYLLVFRPLRRAPQLAKIVASVGLMIVLEALASAIFGSRQHVVPAVLSGGSFSLAGQQVPIDRLEALAVVVAATLALAGYFRFARTGLAIAAIGENERSVSLLGYSPQRLALAVWAISGAAAGLFGVLIAPIVQLNTVNYTLFIVPALAVALVGRLRSVTVTASAGVALGIAQSELSYLKGSSWFPGWAQVGVEAALPLLIILVALLAYNRRVFGRGGPGVARLPRVNRSFRITPLLALTALLGLCGLFGLDGTYRFGLIQTMAAALVMLSFVVLTGYAGQISLAQVAIAGSAGLALTRFSLSAHLPFPLAPALGATVAAAVGIVVALPALRIRGIELAVLTLAFAAAVESFVFGNPTLDPSTLPELPGPRLFGLDLSVRAGDDIARIPFGLLCLVLLLAAMSVIAALLRGRAGLHWLAVRSNERVAAAAGVDVTATKLHAFAVASFLAGLGGALMTYSLGQFSPASFDTLAVGLAFLAFAYLGGITSLGGALVAALLCPGGLVYVVLNRYLNDLGPYYLLISGIGLVLTAVAYPEGIVGTLSDRLGVHARRPSAPAGAGTTTADPPHRAGAGLHVTALTVEYGGLRAVDSAGLQVGRGEIVGLIGPNGAGKTSLIDAISGFTAYSGRVEFGGASLHGLPPHRIAHRGLVRTWQNPDLFADLSVGENLAVSAPAARGRGIAARPFRHPAAPAAIARSLNALGLTALADRAPDELSLGQQKLVAIARALTAGPGVLLLDEPAAGLDTSESAQLGQHLRALAERGVGMLLVEHDMDLVFSICDRVLVLEFGKLIASGTPAQVRRDAAVRAAYLGGAADTVENPTGSRAAHPSAHPSAQRVGCAAARTGSSVARVDPQ